MSCQQCESPDYTIEVASFAMLVQWTTIACHWSSVTLSSLLRGVFYCLWYLVSTRNHACRQGTYCDNFMIVSITMILIETLFLVDPENIVISKLSILMNKFPTRLSDSKGCIYRFVDHFLSWFNVFSTLVLDHFFTHEFAIQKEFLLIYKLPAIIRLLSCHYASIWSAF